MLVTNGDTSRYSAGTQNDLSSAGQRALEEGGGLSAPLAGLCGGSAELHCPRLSQVGYGQAHLDQGLTSPLIPCGL